MEKGLNKKYGLITAIAMVVGIVIGSGVFFKAEAILTKTGGDMVIGILAWVIGGLIMMICAYTFAVMATKFEYVNGLVDYAEATAGKRYGYLVGWFMSTIYYPAMTSVLAWVSARYLCVLFGFDIAGAQCMVIAGFFLIASYALNALSPVLAGKFQVSTTVIKLVPLALMAVFGIIFGLKNGVLIENFTHVIPTAEIETAFAAAGKTYAPSSSPFLASVVAAAFAYEGW
ncbi:MAG: amino acid permease, partial [Oscillospiraceae bacterium]